MKKFLAILLALCMVLSLSVTAFAAEYNDTDGHWAEGAIDRWSEYEIVNGKGEGVFDPNGLMLRAEAAQVFANLFKLSGKADLSEFTDVGLGKWYDDAIAKCVKAGILGGKGEGVMDPEGTITREEFFVMFARALGIQPEEKAEVSISDGAKAADWASGYIVALVNKGYVKGVASTDGSVTVDPKADINRASVMSLLDQTITIYVDTADAVVAGDGLVLIVVDNAKVSLKDSAGKAEIYVFGKNVAISDAPAGTTVTTADEATGVTVNGKDLSKDTTIVVEEKAKPAAGGGGGHIHSYTVTTPATCTTDGVQTCACGDTQTIKATGHAWNGSGVCTHSGCGETKETAMKFSFAVKSGASTVDMTVFDDYSFIINVPNSTVDASSVTGTVKMQNVDSLGVDGLRQHSVTVNTGITGHDGIALGTYLGNAWTLSQNTATVNFNIDGKACTYVIRGNNKTINAAEGTGDDVELYGTPANIEATRAAWQALAANIDTTTGGADDSYVLIKHGSSLQNGTELLAFEEGYTDDLKLDNFSDLNTLKTSIKSAVALGTASANTDVITGYLRAGTELKVGSSSATLKNNATITVNTTVPGALTDIRTASDESTTALVKLLVDQIDDLMGSVSGKTINVGITFAKDN